MEEEFPKKRNIRPKEKSNLPIITLAVLVLLVFAILYVGYEYINDDSTSSEELTSLVVEKPTNQTVSVDEPLDPTTDNTPVVKVIAPPATPTIKVEEVKKETTQNAPTKQVSASSIGGKQITHKVKNGETWTSIAARYNLKLETLQGLNSDVTSLKANTTNLKIQIKDTHNVGAGDVLRVVAEKYGISKNLLMSANGKTKDFAARGEKLIIPFGTKK